MEIVVDYTMQIPELQRNLLLLILDGVGVARKSPGNAVTLSNPQNLIKLWNAFPHTYLKASSEFVGLPESTNGNSEVGHLNIGAGRIMYQNLPKINNAIQKGHFTSNNTLKSALLHAQKYNSKVHILGCFSDGSTHSHIDHFISTLEFFKTNNFNGIVNIHAFTDGRDTPPQSASKYFEKIEDVFANLSLGRIATICGRSLAMDRNNQWNRTKKAYDLLVNGIAENTYKNWNDCLNNNYSKNITDEFIHPSAILSEQDSSIENINTVVENDVVIFLNFRADRAIQLSKAINSDGFTQFSIKSYSNLFFCSIVEYEKSFPEKVLFPKEYIKLPLGRIVAEEGLRQLRIAESEKFPHVTYFFNGGVPLKYQAEDRIEIPSPNVPTYDLKPEMSSLEVLNKATQYITTDAYNLIVMNIAAGDMVAHTGNIDATVKAMQVIDYVTGRLVDYALSRNWTIVITADHGNAEELINLTTNQIDTEHSQNLVPLIIVNKKLPATNLNIGSLSDIAPTILKLLSIQIPSEMSGSTLI